MSAVHARPEVWERIEGSPEFRELVARRRRFVLPATIFFLVWYLGFVLLAGYAEDFMGQSIYEGFTVGYALALTQFLMVAVLGLSYLRYSDRVLDPLRVRVAELAGQAGIDEADRFTRPGAAEVPGAPRGPAAAQEEVPR
jgi:uncharacterized membrane protein (DUF485 family)